MRADLSNSQEAEVLPDLCIYSIFNNKGKPAITCVLDVGTGDITPFLLYLPDNNKTSIYDIKQTERLIADLIMAASANNHHVAISDFKAHLAAFPIELCHTRYNVYDFMLPEMSLPRRLTDQHVLDIQDYLRRMGRSKLRVWQRLLANAAVVYQDLENTGVMIGGLPHFPVWSQRTYSGRSKTLGTNIQGLTDQHQLTLIDGNGGDVYIHFDWVAADVRIASLLSGDELLCESFLVTDPYTLMYEALRTEGDSVSRADCKALLLQTINSLRPDMDTIGVFFPDLCHWLSDCIDVLDIKGSLRSVLGRRFLLEEARAKNKKAVFNATMQGSVGHGMHNAVRRVWESYRSNLLLEVHDAMTLCCSGRNIDLLETIIADVGKIMCRPFDGILDENPMFPVKVSIGTEYRKYSFLKTLRI